MEGCFMRMALLSVVVLGACKVTSPDSNVFACTADADCGAGYRCLEKICRSQASLTTGSPNEGKCAQACAPDRKLCCGTSCVDPASDVQNCGACGHACPTGESCLGGTCTRETTGKGSCSNGIDDDGDGLTDCADTSDCADGTACRRGICCHARCASEATPALCSNGLDDDCDGRIDCEEDSCQGVACGASGAGKVCGVNSTTQKRACLDGCFIDGAFSVPGATRSQGPCFVCDPAKSISAWTPVAAGVASGTCQETHACDGRGACRRSAGQPCVGAGDCASHICTGGLCVQ